MPNKMLFILKKIACIVILILIYHSSISQNFIGFSKNDILLIKGKNYAENTSAFLKYDFPDKILLGKSVKSAFESFVFQNDIVTRYCKIGLFDEADLLKIIKSNNENFKRVDVGKKQGFFQWIDREHQINFKLDSYPMDIYIYLTYIVEKE